MHLLDSTLAGENRLLATLPAEERERLMTRMQVTQMHSNQVIHLSRDVAPMVYFPVTAVVALVNTLASGDTTEVGAVGNEGMTGIPLLLGARSEPSDMIVLISGTAYQMSSMTFSAEVSCPGPLRDLLLRYTQTVLDYLAQKVACSSHHTVRQRLAAWLLAQRDRVNDDALPITHELLGHMLGAGRPSVTLAADALQKTHLIRLTRGFITIVDRPGLEVAACECYQLGREQNYYLFR